MDTRYLSTFIAVARAGSFAAHAREIGIDPSLVSRQIAALEAEIGVRLFTRSTRSLSLTEAGQVYLDRIAPLVDGLREASDAARENLAEPSGTLSITSSVAFGERWLMPRLPAFRTNFPKIDFNLHLTDAVVDLTTEPIDLALRLGPRLQGSLVGAKLFDTRYRVVASPDYLNAKGRPADPTAIAVHDGILFSLPGFRDRWRFRRANAQHEAIPRAAFTISNALAIRRAALDGLGIALLADWTIADDLAEGCLMDLFPDWQVSASDFDSAVWLAYRDRHHVPERLRVFIDYCRSTLRTFPLGKSGDKTDSGPGSSSLRP